MIEKVILFFCCVVLAGVCVITNALINRWEEQGRQIRGLKGRMLDLEEDLSRIQGIVEAHVELLSDIATKEDIEREAKAVLNIRNEIGKLGNRVQTLEKESNK